MPIPNGSAATATVITSLPWTETEAIGAGEEAWWVYTATTGVSELGVFALGGTPHSLLSVFSPTASDPYPDDGFETYSLINLSDCPVQFVVDDGQSYWLKVTCSGGGAGTTQVSVLAGPNVTVPVGSLFVHDDNPGFPLACLSATDGSVLQFRHPVVSGEYADVLPDGRYLIQDIDSYDLKLYSAQAVLLATISGSGHGSFQLWPIRTNQHDSFYVGAPSDPTNSYNATVRLLNADTATFGGTTWTLAASGLVALAPSPDETILYYTGSGGTVNVPIKRWDLVNNLALSDLAAGISGFRAAHDLLCLSDGTVIAPYRRNSGTTAPQWQIKHYATDGSTLATYQDTAFTVSDLQVAYALDDPLSFWVWLKIPGGATGISRFRQIQISDGSVLTSFDCAQYEAGVYAPLPKATPTARFGHSFSCHFFVLRVEMPAVPTTPPIEPITGTVDATLSAASGGTAPLSAALTGYVLPPRHLEHLCAVLMTLSALAPDARQRVFSAIGITVPGAKLFSYEAGSTTNLATYNDAALTVPNTNPLIADASGTFGPIYLLPQAYKFVVTDADDLELWSQDSVFDVGELLQATIATLQAQLDSGVFETLTVTDMPTADPHVVGKLWNDSNTVKISAG